MMSTVPLGESNANKAVKPPRRRGPKKQLGDVTKGSETTTSTPAPATPVEAVHVENVALEPPKLERNERESLKDLSKRLKRHTKKLADIKRSEDKIKDLPDGEKETTLVINADERRKIKEKRITEAVARELQEIHDKLQSCAEAEDKILDNHLAEQKRYYEARLAKEVKEAKEEGLKQAKEEMLEQNNDRLNTLLKFLRLAGYRRSIKDENPNVEEDAAIEHVLVLVYSADAAMEASMKLADASSEPVGEEHTVSYARLKELAHALNIDDDEEPQPEATDATTEAPESESTTVVATEAAKETDSTETAANTAVEEAPSVTSGQELGGGWVDVKPEEAEPTEEGSALVESTGNVLPASAQDNTDEKQDEFRDVASKRGGGDRGGRGRGGPGRGRGRGDGFRGRGRGGYRGDFGGEHRELRPHHEYREPREPREHREPREPREPRPHHEHREPREFREPREPREHRPHHEHRGEHRGGFRGRGGARRPGPPRGGSFRNSNDGQNHQQHQAPPAAVAST